MKLVKFIVAVSCAAALSACGTAGDFGAYKTGTQVTDEQMQTFADKKTKQGDVVATVGQPQKKELLGAKEVWRYDYTQIGQAIIGKNISETTVFEFDKKGVLLSHYKTGGAPGTSSNPLLRAAGQ